MKATVSEHVIYRLLGDEAVILDLSRGMYFGLDPVAARMWQLLAEHGSTEATVGQLLVEYDVDEPQLRDDVEAFARQLQREGFLVIASE
jgi:hypothetical protein